MVNCVVVDGVGGQRDQTDIDQRQSDHHDRDQEDSETVCPRFLDRFNVALKCCEDFSCKIRPVRDGLDCLAHCSAEPCD